LFCPGEFLKPGGGGGLFLGGGGGGWGGFSKSIISKKFLAANLRIFA